jgi:tRNA threonylcarbamoyladenosine biosynthesis protein TsaB
MILLAIDTSGRQGGIALARAVEREEDIELIESTALAGGSFSAQLIPQIAQMLSRNSFAKHDIAAIAVAAGPGSFTGLRIGLAAVKALAEVLQKPIAAVSLLQVCAMMSAAQGKVMAALDAGRGDVYVGEYRIPSMNGGVGHEYMLNRSEFLAQAKGWTVVSPDAGLIEASAAAGLPLVALPTISAADVARVGWVKLRRGETIAPEQLEANYIRRTDAEMLDRMGP